MAARILYIEDYPIIQQIYVDVLKKYGYEVDVASDGKEALEKIKTARYDLLLVDLLLPQLTGVEFLHRYQQGDHMQDQNTKVIVLTDFDGPEALQQVKDLGIEDYWIKVNNTPYALAEKIEAVLSGKPLPKDTSLDG